MLTGRRSRKAAAIRAAGRFGLCVRDARRYLGAAGGDRYVAGNPDPGRENVAFRMRPEHWLSQDQGKGQAKG